MRLLRRSDAETDTLFLHIFDTYHTRLFNYVYRMVGCRDSAEDVVQTIFLKVYQHLPRYRDEQKLTSWMFKIAHNTTYDYFRKTQAQHQVFQDVENIDLFPAPGGGSGFVSPEDSLVTQEMQEHLDKILINLPQKLKEVFLLRHEAGLSFKEMSKILHCPINRLLGRMHLAVKTIREDMQPFMNGD